MSWLSPFRPELREDPPSILAARASMAMRLSLLTVALGLGLFTIDRLAGVPLGADSSMTLVLAAMGVLAWVLLRNRRYQEVAWLLVFFLFGNAAMSAWFFGSVRTINIWLLLMGQVAAGIFLGRRGVWITTLCAIALFGFLTLADAHGWMAGTPHFVVGWRTWLTQTLCLMGVAAMMYLNRTQMRMAQSLHLEEAMQRLQVQLDRDIGHGRFSRLFRNSPDPMFVQSEQTGAILDVNRAFEQMLGRPRKDLVGKTDDPLWLHDEQHKAFARDRRRHHRTGWHAVTAIGRDGQRIPLQVCTERDDASDDNLRINVLRMPGTSTVSLPTAFAPMEDGLDV